MSLAELASRNQLTTHDMDLIAAVIRIAHEPGYVLIGPTERVWRRHENRRGQIEHVPLYEDGAVHQLIAQRLLRPGGSVYVYYGRHEGPARAVLVTRAAIAEANRWIASRWTRHITAN